ncbi:hypothetical protein GCM10025777_19760 [Membranihabitans marinus]
MVWQQESVIHSGTVFKFRTAPVDPVDVFRGRYVALNYADNQYEMSEKREWRNGETIYVVFKKDDFGYAIIDSISKERPANVDDYLKTTVDYFTSEIPQTITVVFPFDRLYMEESKAQNAEEIYRREGSKGEKETYGLVSIKEGRAVLLDVFIDNISIREIAGRTVN